MNLIRISTLATLVAHKSKQISSNSIITLTINNSKYISSACQKIPNYLSFVWRIRGRKKLFILPKKLNNILFEGNQLILFHWLLCLLQNI